MIEIKIKIGDKEVSVEEARKLYEELRDFFKEPIAPTTPYCPLPHFPDCKQPEPYKPWPLNQKWTWLPHAGTNTIINFKKLNTYEDLRS